MKPIILTILLLESLLSAGQKSEHEILYLLNVVETTKCKYIRNGDIYSGPQAVKHIQKKYDYFKNDINSAEDFIRLSATKSTMSGRKYHILCKGEDPYDSDVWLLLRLSEYRSNIKKKETK